MKKTVTKELYDEEKKTQNREEPRDWFCAGCGEKNRSQAKFCAKCGKKKVCDLRKEENIYEIL